MEIAIKNISQCYVTELMEKYSPKYKGSIRERRLS
jgi:hypothetical protein